MSHRNLLFSIIAALVGLPTLASAQAAIGRNSNSYVQNYYNRSSQPLSPYLNLLRGGNQAVNYFYGVRPGTSTGALGSPFTLGMGSQGRQTFFPQIDTLYELEDVKPTDGIQPTGHPFGFNNGMGYFGTANSQGGSGRRR